MMSMKKAINAILSVVLLAGAVNTSVTAHVSAEETEEPVTETAEITEEAAEETPETEETPENEEPAEPEAPAETEEPGEPEAPAETEAPEPTNEPEVTPEPTDAPEETPETVEEPEETPAPEEELTEESEEEADPELLEEDEEGYELFVDGGDYALRIMPNGGTWNPDPDYSYRLNKGAELYANILNNPQSPSQILSGMNLTREGYIVIGLDKKKDVKEPKYKVNSKYDYSTKRGVTITLYVIWQPLSYPIFFDANGGHFGSDATTTKISDDKPIPQSYAIPYKATRPGYKLLGWAKSASAEEPEFLPEKKYRQYTENESTSTEITLYAVWAPVQYKVTMKANGGIIAGQTKAKASVTGTYSVEDDLDLSSNGVSRAGYAFAGWYKDSKFKNPVTMSDLREKPGKIKTIYAKWEAMTYNVSLSTRNYFGLPLSFKAGANTSFTHTSGKSKAINVTPVIEDVYLKKMYKFTGWSESIYDEKPSFKNTTKYKVFSADGANKELVPIFAPVSYKVTLKTNGGILAGQTKSKASVTKSYSMMDHIDLSAITRKGYTFDGWYKDAKFKTPVTMQDLLVNAGKIKTIYAKWTPKTYNVTVYANDEGAYYTTSVTANTPFHDGPSPEDQERTVTLTFGKAAVLPQPVCYGRTFVGYALTTDAKSAKFKKNTKYKSYSPDGEDIELYAVWK